MAVKKVVLLVDEKYMKYSESDRKAQRWSRADYYGGLLAANEYRLKEWWKELKKEAEKEGKNGSNS